MHEKEKIKKENQKKENQKKIIKDRLKINEKNLTKTTIFRQKNIN